MVYVVSDWNGTIFEYKKDDVQNKALAMAALKTDLVHLRLGSASRLLSTRKRLKKMLEEHYAGNRPLKDLYDTFNAEVLRGRSVDFVHSAINRYAEESASKVDKRVLVPIIDTTASDSRGILSVSYGYSITQILALAGYSPWYFEKNLVSNSLELDDDGKVLGLTLDIYGRKPEVLKDEFFDKREFKDKETVYLGDDRDDEGVAVMLPKGNFIVPFFASDEFRQKMASRHGAFVPKDQADLQKYLESRS